MPNANNYGITVISLLTKKRDPRKTWLIINELSSLQQRKKLLQILESEMAEVRYFSNIGHNLAGTVSEIYFISRNKTFSFLRLTFLLSLTTT